MSRFSARVPFPALLSFLLVVGSSLGVQAQKIHVVYDKQVDFSQFKTFAWAPHGAVAHPLLAADVVGAIEDELKQRGLKKVEITENPGLIIEVYGSIDQDSTFYSNDPLYNATGGVPPFDPSFSGFHAYRNVRQHDGNHPQRTVGGRPD